MLTAPQVSVFVVETTRPPSLTLWMKAAMMFENWMLSSTPCGSSHSSQSTYSTSTGGEAVSLAKASWLK